MPLTSLSPVFVKFLKGSMEPSTLHMMYWSMDVTTTHLSQMLLISEIDMWKRICILIQTRFKSMYPMYLSFARYSPNMD